MDGFPVNSQSPVHVPLSLSMSSSSALLLQRRRHHQQTIQQDQCYFLFSPTPKRRGGQETAQGVTPDVQAIKDAVVSQTICNDLPKGSTHRKTLFLAPENQRRVHRSDTFARVARGEKTLPCCGIDVCQ